MGAEKDSQPVGVVRDLNPWRSVLAVTRGPSASCTSTAGEPRPRSPARRLRPLSAEDVRAEPISLVDAILQAIGIGIAVFVMWSHSRRDREKASKESAADYQWRGLRQDMKREAVEAYNEALRAEFESLDGPFGLGDQREDDSPCAGKPRSQNAKV